MEKELNLNLVTPGNSLVVQLLGLCAFTAEDAGSIPGQRIKILQATWPKKKKKKKLVIYIYHQRWQVMKSMLTIPNEGGILSNIHQFSS